jgi:hypothetical protein
MPELATIYNRHTGATETLPGDQAALKTFYQRDEWSSQPLPPPGWELEVPRWRITRHLQPAQFPRVRLEPPCTDLSCGDSWQYSDRHYEAGEEIESKCWPHPSMYPLNYSAQRVMAFFNSATRSRLTTSPWHSDRVRLDDGLSGPLPTVVRPPQVSPFNSRPAA